ncbi:unnamed protein product [Schistosoma rodhaini]|uniref:Uncharacterized protein n=1 Tax=Schistosoma rodhaini TaxID=6188 RepID=A0A183QGM7_9TREM|nr:unnamed protein product [Schistosoma rodhaini]
MIWYLILLINLIIGSIISNGNTNHNEDKSFLALPNNNIYTRSHFSNKIFKEEHIEEESIELPEYHHLDDESLNALNVSKIHSNETSTNSSLLLSSSSETLNKSKKKSSKNLRKVFRKQLSSIDMGFSGSYYLCSNANLLNIPNIFYHIFTLISVMCFMTVS